MWENQLAGYFVYISPEFSLTVNWFPGTSDESLEVRCHRTPDRSSLKLTWGLEPRVPLCPSLFQRAITSPTFPLAPDVTLGPSTRPPHPGYTTQSLSFLSRALHPGSLWGLFFFFLIFFFIFGCARSSCWLFSSGGKQRLVSSSSGQASRCGGFSWGAPGLPELRLPGSEAQAQ